jgi:SAM-dependent methyltransferase
LYATPQVNPNLETGKKSLSGIYHESVLSALDQLYPPQGLQMRNAASRTDGYWAFISQGEEPPMDLTYGEFDFHFFAQILDRAHHHYYYQSHEENTPNTWKDKVMLDMGSGTGRLVLGAASLHPDWKECRGIELLQGIHDFAVEKLAECTGDNASRVLPSVVENSSPLTMAPVKLTCGSFEDPSISLGDVDCAFAFSSCFSTDLMKRLGQAVGRQCKPGAIIITTDYMIPLENSIPPIEEDDRTGSYKLELAEKLDGWCWLTGGESTAYIHRVVHGLSS